MFNLTTASQSNMPAVLVANGLGVCLVLAILLARRKRDQALSYDDKCFFWMCRLCLILCLLETTGFFLDGKIFPGAQLLTAACSATILLLAGATAYIWVCYVDYRLFNDRHRLQRLRWPLAIPAVLLGLMAMVNFFTTIFFQIDGDNVYHRSPIFFLPWLIMYFYMTYTAVITYYYRKRMHKYLFMPVMIFLIPIYVGSLIQLLYYGISLIWVSVALALTFLYINRQDEENCLDPLTGLYNRNYLIYHMDCLTKKARKGCRITGMLLDINNFKQINDTYGHIKGDGALHTVGTILLHSVDNSATVIRYGGDEFLIFLENAAPEDIARIQANIDRELYAYNTAENTLFQISLSSGVAELHKADIFHFFQEMDKKMYEEKRASDLSPDSAE